MAIGLNLSRKVSSPKCMGTWPSPSLSVLRFTTICSDAFRFSCGFIDLTISKQISNCVAKHVDD